MHLRTVILLPTLLLILAHTSASAAPACPATPAYPEPAWPLQSFRNDIPPRLQWNANYGYCGETSFISAGLYYGQYISQYEARALASPGVPQQRYRSQLLLGVNDRAAARRMRLKAEYLYTRAGADPSVFLSWVKRNVLRGFPVAIGVYENQAVFHESAPDTQYDHIVPVVGIASRHDRDDPAYYGDDTIVFSDNGLYTPESHEYPFYFSYAFDDFLKNRKQANQGRQPYALAKTAGNYGMAFTGVMDAKLETVPVRVDTAVNCERPAIKNGTSTAPAPTPLELTITVSGLTPELNYLLYEYGRMQDVPNGDFTAPDHAAAAIYCCAIPLEPGIDSFITRQSIYSDQSAIFRAVKVSAKPSDIPDCPTELFTRQSN